MNRPLGNEVEGDPVTPGLYIVADVDEVSVRSGVLDQELDNKSGRDEKQNE